MSAEEIQIIIPGEPVGKGRPRFSVVAGHAKAFTPKKTRDYEELIKWHYVQQNPGKRFDKEDALSIFILAEMGIAPSNSKTVQQQKRTGEIRPMKKPDADNIVKIVQDALNGLAYEDDVQIVESHIIKRYSDAPGLNILIRKV